MTTRISTNNLTKHIMHFYVYLTNKRSHNFLKHPISNHPCMYSIIVFDNTPKPQDAAKYYLSAPFQ